MKVKTLFLLLILPIMLVGAVGAGYYFFFSPHPTQNTAEGTVPEGLAWKFPPSAIKFPSTGSPGIPSSSVYSSIPVPGGTPQGLPLRLEIPIIGVDSSIEDAFITPDGQMEVPAGTVDVAWFALGPRPGQTGSAVIGGHFGIQNNIPFVFYNLDKLKVGDMIYILNDEGNTITFIIRSIASFAANADATPVFTSSDGLAHLNLITCEGIWNEVAGNYPDRLVVFTDEINSTGTAPTTALSIDTFPRTLSIGASGPDVTALQIALEEKGFLTLPATIATGYFGILTSNAVSAYQISVGLPVVGVFGPLTRSSLIAQLAINSILPHAGVETTASSTGAGTITPVPSSLLQTLLQWITMLYATPFDSIITSLLLLAIIFLLFKIVRRR